MPDRPARELETSFLHANVHFMFRAFRNEVTYGA
jgi:hypothetical protein